VAGQLWVPDDCEAVKWVLAVLSHVGCEPRGFFLGTKLGSNLLLVFLRFISRIMRIKVQFVERNDHVFMGGSFPPPLCRHATLL
jgi:hypothetical protein